MPRKEFQGATLEEVQKAVKHWKRDHPRMTITKEYRPVEFLYDGTHFLSKNKGSGGVIGALIVIDYEDPPIESPSLKKKLSLIGPKLILLMDGGKAE